nr:hypothetical protein [Tanacetum cinerariifolium]
MDTIIDQQVAMDEALVPHAQRLRIGRSNFFLSNIKFQRRAMRCTILGSRRLSSTTSCQRILLFQGGTSSNITITPPTAAAGPRLTTSTKGKQVAKASKAKSLSALSEIKELVVYQGFLMYPLISLRKNSPRFLLKMKEVIRDDDDDDQEVVRDDEKDNEEEGKDDEQEYNEDEYNEETRDEESFDAILKTPKNSDDEGNGEEDFGLNVGREKGHDEEEEEDKLYKDVNINQGRGIQATLEVEDSHVTLTTVNPDFQQQSSSVSSQFVTSMLNPTLDIGMESIFETTSQMDAQTPTSVAPLPMTAPTMTPSTIATITTTSQVPIPHTKTLSSLIQDLPNFKSLFGFNNSLRTLEANFSEFMQTNQFARAVSPILGIVQRYMDQQMNEAIKVAIQIQSDRLCNEAQKENDKFFKTVDENMQNIIKEQTSYDVVADLSEMELNKILIEKMEGNKSIQRSDEQRNLYKALIEAYESNKIC